MKDSLYFHPELKNRSEKHFWIHPIMSFFKKRKNKINFICFTTLMMNLFIIMEFTVKIESLWGLTSVGKFYLLIYVADVIGAILSFCLVNRFSRVLLNRIHSSLIFVLSLILVIISLSQQLSSTVEIIFLSKCFFLLVIIGLLRVIFSFSIMYLFTYNSELFPSKIRILTLGSSVFITKIVLAFLALIPTTIFSLNLHTVSYRHLRAHETRHDLVCRLLLE